MTESAVHDSNTEPTLVARTSRPLTAEEATGLSADLKQDAIAQMGPSGNDLFGPKASEWGPLLDFFLDLDGKHPRNSLSTPTSTRRQRLKLKTDPKSSKEYLGKGVVS